MKRNVMMFCGAMLGIFLATMPASAKEDKKMEKAVFGGGCFWCVEAIFENFKGVKSVVSGYAGGKLANPSYRAITTGATGHAEVVEITYDPSQVSFRELLEIHMDTHDPTTLNRQGADRGTQYRSVVFCKNDEQKKITKEVIAELTKKKVYADPIVTQVADDVKFWVAEEYHQDYFERNPSKGYCQVVIRPKVEKFQKKQAEKKK